MKQKIGNVCKSIPFLATVLVISLVSTLLYNAFRVVWCFMDLYVFGFEDAMLLLGVILVVNLLVLSGLLALRIYEVKRNDKLVYQSLAYSIIEGIALFLALFGLVVVIVYLKDWMFQETFVTVLITFGQDVQEYVPFIWIPFLVFFYPAFKGKGRILVGGLTIAGVLLGLMTQAFPVMGYEITSKPMVIDTGEDYSVVFSTSDTGTAYVTYTYEGEEYVVYDQKDGGLVFDTRIHSVNIPYEHLKNNTYTVGSTQVFEYFGYGRNFGNMVTSEEYSFKVNESDTQNWLVITDWHYYVLMDMAEDAIAHLNDEYDGLILVGDPAPALDHEQQAIWNIAQFGGKLSGGEMPVIYARGNHDSKGAFSRELSEVLGLDSLYYSTNYGDYSFVILDSGESNEDSDPENQGMIAHRDYHEEMVEWMEGLELESEKAISIAHIWQVCVPEDQKDLSLRAWDSLEKMGVDLMLSGHDHVCRFVDGSVEGEQEYLERYSDLPAFIAGGHVGDNYAGFVATKMKLSTDGICFTSMDNNGEQVMDKLVEWD